jgi:hypothetical protein
MELRAKRKLQWAAAAAALHAAAQPLRLASSPRHWQHDTLAPLSRPFNFISSSALGAQTSFERGSG